MIEVFQCHRSLPQQNDTASSAKILPSGSSTGFLDTPNARSVDTTADSQERIGLRDPLRAVSHAQHRAMLPTVAHHLNVSLSLVRMSIVSKSVYMPEGISRGSLAIDHTDLMHSAPTTANRRVNSWLWSNQIYVERVRSSSMESPLRLKKADLALFHFQPTFIYTILTNIYIGGFTLSNKLLPMLVPHMPASGNILQKPCRSCIHQRLSKDGKCSLYGDKRRDCRTLMREA